MPGTHVLKAVLTALQDAGIVAALGGSGLLAALGLTDRVRDWDVTTDAHPQVVQNALTAAGIPFTPQPSGDGRYATRARLRVDGADHGIDLIVGFAIRTHDGEHHLPTTVTGHWHDLPLADPAVWARAYHLIDRPEPAAALDTWLATRHQPTVTTN